MTAPIDAASCIAIIHRRRSVRHGFAPTDVPDEVVEQILGCGCRAPSSKDAQHWRLHAVRDRTVLTEVADEMSAAMTSRPYVPLDPVTGDPADGYVSSVAESADVLRRVPLAVFVEDDGLFSGGRDGAARARRELLPEILVGYGFELIGIGAAIQNMWLAAEALGLSGVFMGDVRIVEETVRTRLDMAGDLIGSLALGFASEPAQTPKAVKAGRAIIHPAP